MLYTRCRELPWDELEPPYEPELLPELPADAEGPSSDVEIYIIMYVVYMCTRTL